MSLLDASGPHPVAARRSRGDKLKPRAENRAMGLGITREIVAASIVYAAVLFNFGLAFVNANGMAIGRTHVILVELALVATTFVFCLRFWSPLMMPWAWVIWMLGTIFLTLSLARQSVDPKHVRDVLLIPIFIMLGIASGRGNIVKVMCGLQAIVLVILIFEAASPHAYGNIFNVTSYYINTRDFKQEAFWNPGSNLFMSSLRPGERFIFPWLGIHRLSSVFLEPVSLGNWCIVITLFITSFWQSLSRRVRIFLVVSNAMVLIGCDGRLAIVNCFLLGFTPLLAKLPRYIYFLYLPGIVLPALLVVIGLNLEPTGDNFVGRIAYSMNALANMDIGALLGVDLTLINKGADSGITYFIMTQSLLGALALWSALCFLQPATSRRAVILMHGICLYLSLNLMVSFSLFSIKTAAPLWFLYGYVRSRTYLESAARRTQDSHVFASASGHIAPCRNPDRSSTPGWHR